MCSVSDIPLVGKILDKIYDKIVEAGIRGLRYLLCSKKIVENLKNEIKQVEYLEEKLGRKVTEEKNQGKTIEEPVTRWQEGATKLKVEVEELEQRYRGTTSCRCFGVVQLPNPVSRFQLGRKAAEMTNGATEQAVSGKAHVDGEIAYLPPNEHNQISKTKYQKFVSRDLAYSQLWKALKKEDGDPILGIYGMPGTGKTTMMEEISKQAKAQGIFQRVARANVSSEVDVKAIQEQLAVSIDLEFKEGGDRAFLLKNRLEKEEKILVVLDDVWKKIPLYDIGIPFGDGSFKGCKILLTSREKEVCLHNKCPNPIEIENLKVGEAWDLFKEIVDTSNIARVGDCLAREVCEECGGLPLLINAVGEALKFKTKATWEDSLNLLQNCQFRDLPGIDPKVYVCLKVSFDQLDKYAKACLFLCSVFDEDYEISVEKELLILASGTELLKDLDTIEAARTRVVSSVDRLKSSSLLIDCHDKVEVKVKVHDIIRDVASSIANEESEYAFLIKRNLSRWPRSDDCGAKKLLRLTFDEEVPDLSDQKLVCPDLHTLWLQGRHYGNCIQLPDDCLIELANLRSLFLTRVSLNIQKSSLQTLFSLRVLRLHECQLSDNPILLVKELEILILDRCKLPMPLDLRGLNRLRKLEFSNRNNDEIVKVLRHVISSLSNLEELCIPMRFRIWDEATNKEVPIFEEINQLTRLRNLDMEVKDGDMSCPDDRILNNLRRFHITIGSLHPPIGRPPVNTIKISGISLRSWMKALAERAEVVSFAEVTGLQDVFVNNNNREEAFKDLTVLKILYCPEMEHLDGMSTRVVKYPAENTMPFYKLRRLTIDHCSRLKYLFSASTARCLMHLDSLYVSNCKVMEEIIRKEEEEVDIIALPSLRYMDLGYLPKLTNFYRQKTPPNHSQSFLNKVEFPNLEAIWLTNLNISTLFTLSDVTKSLQQLNEIHVKGCKSLEEIVRDEDPINRDHVDPLVLPKLTRLSLDDLPKLTTFNRQMGSANHNQSFFSKVEFQNLERITLRNLNISTLFTLSDVTKSLQQLNEIYVKGCKSLEEIVRDEDPINRDHVDPLVLPKLTRLSLDDLPKLTTFNRQMGSANHNQSFFSKVEFQNLERITLRNLNISTLFTLSDVTKSLQQLNEIHVKGCKSLEEIVRDEDPINRDHVDPLVLPKLTCLSLDDLPKLTTFNRQMGSANHIQSFFSKVEFQNLERITLRNLNISTLFTLSDVTKSLQQLELIEVERCKSLEEIVRDEDPINRDHVDPLVLPKLTRLSLDDLPKLTTFNRQMGSANHNQSFFSKVEFPNLEAITLRNLNISTLFTLSDVTKSLQQLELIEVERCKSLEEIVRDEDPINRDHVDPLVLPKLTRLSLDDLPKLTTFNRQMGSANHIQSFFSKVEFPNLEAIWLTNLNISTLFTLSDVTKSLQQLNEIHVKGCKSLEEIVRDEDPINRDHVDPLVLPKLTCLSLDDLPKLTTFNRQMGSANHIQSFFSKVEFPNLEAITLRNLNISTLFTLSDVTKSLQQLELIEVERCKSLEEIVRDEDPINRDHVDPLVLPKLTRLSLDDLPKLTTFNRQKGSANHNHSLFSKVAFPNLEAIRLSNLNISTLFTLSDVTRSLQQLEDLSVTICELVEEIIVSSSYIDIMVDGDESSSSNPKEISIPKLKNISLADLPKLRRFSGTRNYAFNMPSLKIITLEGCDLEITTTPSEIVINNGGREERASDLNLNHYIQQQNLKRVAQAPTENEIQIESKLI